MKKTSAYARKRRSLGLPVTIRFSQQHEIDLQLTPHTTLDKFRDGSAMDGDYHLLALRLNWARLLAEEHFPDCVEPCIEAQLALHGVAMRHQTKGQWGIAQPEFAAICFALNTVDDMQLNCTRRELRDALEAVYLANDNLSRQRGREIGVVAA